MSAIQLRYMLSTQALRLLGRKSAVKNVTTEKPGDISNNKKDISLHYLSHYVPQKLSDSLFL